MDLGDLGVYLIGSGTMNEVEEEGEEEEEWEEEAID
jgi:hypothetical protein